MTSRVAAHDAVDLFRLDRAEFEFVQPDQRETVTA